MGKLIPIVGKYYTNENNIFVIVHVGAKTFSYSYVNSDYFNPSDVFTWDLKTFRNVEVTELLAALL